MHKITKLRIGEIKKQRYDEYIKHCSQINFEAEKAERFRGNTHSLIIIETAYNYVKELFTDIIDIERNALKGRILFLSHDTYFDELISSLKTFLLAEYKNFLDQEFLSTSTAYEAGRYQNPLNDLLIQKKIEEYSDRIHRLTADTINSIREEFKQERNKGVLKAVSKIFSIIKYIAKMIIGL
jgi:hypothetical protein